MRNPVLMATDTQSPRSATDVSGGIVMKIRKTSPPVIVIVLMFGGISPALADCCSSLIDCAAASSREMAMRILRVEELHCSEIYLAAMEAQTADCK